MTKAQAGYPPLFHLGYHKTGTSWLQQVYFEQHPQMTPLIDSRYPWRSELVTYLVTSDERRFDSGLARLLYENERPVVKGVPVISAERLSGHAGFGYFDQASIARKIKIAFPEAKVLVVLREPGELAVSWYMQVVREGATYRFSEFLAPRWRRPSLPLSTFDPAATLERYRSIFGDGLLALDYNWLRSDPEAFAARLCGFLGIPEFLPSDERRVNPSLSPAGCELLRRLNRVRRSEYNPAPLIALPDSILIALAKALSRTGLGARQIISETEVKELRAQIPGAAETLLRLR